MGDFVNGLPQPEPKPYSFKKVTLAGNTAYYWQVRAVDAGGSTYGNAGTWWNFTTGNCYTLTTAASPVAGGSIGADVAPNCAGGKYSSGTVLHLTATPAALTCATTDIRGTTIR